MDFITISYNQERYIIEHLESIKFQITHYANRCEVNYRLFDDCSTDLTVTLARQWLEENSQLFSSIDIVENSTNLGLNQNYLQAVRSAESRPFKCLAADDLYNWHNVFDVAEAGDVCFTPVIRFSENIAPYFIPTVEYLYYGCHKYGARHFLEKRLAYAASIETPGAFFPKEFFQHKALIDEVGRYKCIEDLPIWKWLFFSSEGKKYEIRYDPKPLILYRVGSGVTSKSNSANSIFNSERLRAESELHVKRNARPILLNPGRINCLLSWRIYNLIAKKVTKAGREVHSLFNDELAKSESYLKTIISNAEEYVLSVS